ncbi:MAG: protein TolR [Proteobacteria bacterium]|nr:protein TolR [Pseudomonadota bacterium]
MSSSRGGFRGRRRGGPQAMSDINVTPLVDVMLVLLVIFMVTAPLLSVSIPVDLPKTEGKNISADKQPLVITITASSEIYLQETRVKFEALVPRLQAMQGVDPDMRIFVRGDRSLTYGRIMEVMGALSSANFKHVALVADLPKQK